MSDAGGGPLIAALLRVPYQAVIAHVTRRLREDYPDLRPAHLIVFQLVYDLPAGTRLTELAERAQITAQSMGELVDALERGGYLERVPDPADRRAKLIRFTPRGAAAYDRGHEAVEELQRQWGRRLGAAKVEQILSLLRELNASLTSDQHDP